MLRRCEDRDKRGLFRRRSRFWNRRKERRRKERRRSWRSQHLWKSFPWWERERVKNVTRRERKTTRCSRNQWLFSDRMNRDSRFNIYYDNAVCLVFSHTFIYHFNIRVFFFQRVFTRLIIIWKIGKLIFPQKMFCFELCQYLFFFIKF